MINTWMVAAGLQNLAINSPEQEPVTKEKQKRAYIKKHGCWKKKKFGAKHQAILELFKEGVSIDVICDKLGTSLQYVRGILFYHRLIERPAGSDKYCKKRPVIARRVTGEHVGEYDTVLDAARETELSEWSVRQCCTGKIQSSSGMVFRFKEDAASDANQQ